MAGKYAKENSKERPLFLFYDCESAASDHMNADIIEIAARCYPEIRNASFESLICTSQELGKFTVERCGIKVSDLEGKAAFPAVFRKFLKWIENLVTRINQKTGNKHFPVLCAHGGYGFDYPILLSNMRRYNIKEDVLKNKNLHFADTFLFCKKFQEDHHVPELQGIKLSMDSLFSKFCSGKEFLNRHRAMGDVNAMVEIFSKEPFKTVINNIDYVTAESLCEWFTAQNSQKEQKIILEEKMAKLDAYTRTVYSKKLFQLQLTYDTLQSIFENCCSYMDFYVAMQDRGIDRKTAKYFACQFGSMGLRNQGTEPYCNLPKSAVTAGEELDYSLDNVDELLAKEELERQRAPNVPPLPIVNETTVSESTECWDDELDESRSFTFIVPKPIVPLSLTIDDFVSNSPSKQSNISKQSGSRLSRQNSSNSQHQNENSKPVHEVENPSNSRQLSDQTSARDPKNTAKSITKTKMKKEQNPTDVFRNGASSLQLGQFRDKKERYQLEKELLDQIGKVYEENNLEKDEIRKESKKIMKEARVGDISKNKEIVETESTRKEETNNKKFPKNNIHKDNSEKDRIQKQNKEIMRETSVQDISRTEKIFRTESTSPKYSEFLRCKGNRKETSENYETNYQGFPRKFVGKTRRNSTNKDFDAHKQSTSRPGNTDVKTMKQNNNKKRSESSQDTISSTGKTGRDTVILEEKCALKETAVKKSSQDNYSNALLMSSESNISKTSKSSNGFNSLGLVSQQQTMEVDSVATEKMLGELGITDGKKNDWNDKHLQGDQQGQRRNIVIRERAKVTTTCQGDVLQEDSIGQPTISLGNKKDPEKKAKLKRSKQNREPVVFVNRKSTEDKQRNWPRIEIFVGDFPIYVPVQPTKDDQDIVNENVGYIQQGSRSEDKSGKNLEAKNNPCSNSSTRYGDIAVGVLTKPEQSNLLENDVVQIQDTIDSTSYGTSRESQLCEKEQVVDNTTSDEGKEDVNVQIVTHQNSAVESSFQERIALPPGQCDVPVETNEVAESVVTSVMQNNLITVDSNEVVPSLDNSTTLTVDKSSCNLLPRANHVIPVKTAVKTTNSSQQTELYIPWHNEKEQRKLVDEEQQTDCALYTTFNIKYVEMVDKETNTDRSSSWRKQSTETISSYGDNLSESYEHSPSSPFYRTDSQHDVFNAGGYESPTRVFDIAISPSREDRHLEEDIHLGEDRQRYDIPSPNYFTQKYSPQACIYRSPSSNPNAPPQRFLTHPGPPLPPQIYPMNPNHGSGPPLFHPRYPQQYLPRLPGNPSNVLPHQYHGIFKF